MSATDAEAIKKMLAEVPLFARVKASVFKKMDELLSKEQVRFLHFQAGEEIVRQDALDTEFFVVLEGLASAYRTDEDGSTSLLGSYGAGDFFGEMSALSHQPRTATVKADAPCVVLSLDVTLFQKLWEDEKSSFHEIIDERYRERALAFHLRTAPIFKGLPQSILAALAERAQLVSHKKGETVAKEGEEADGVYLIRSGIIKRWRARPDGEEELQEFLCDNSSFGERSLSDDRAWPSNYTTMSRADLVRLPREIFADVFQRDEKTRKQLQATVDVMIAEDKGLASDLSLDEQLELMIGKEAVKGGEALVIDLRKCTRCNACVESCVAVHDDRVPRLSKRGMRAGDLMLSSACYNCEIPECMLSCQFGAIRRDVHGQIHVVLDNCTGCQKCESGCPYGVIRMAQLVGPEGSERPSLLESIPVIGGLFKKKVADEGEAAAPAKKQRPKAIKCDLCAGLPFEACVYNCPCNAIDRISPKKLVGFADVRRV